MIALRARDAVRLGLRAASRNPELAFAKALLDVASTLVSLLPAALAVALLSGAVSAGDLFGFIDSVLAMRWAMAGALLTAAALSFVAGAAFWAGTLPLLAADAELGERPPPGSFGRLVAAGFARVLGASWLGFVLSLLFAAGAAAAIALGAWLQLRRPGAASAAALAAAIAVAIAGSVLLDQLARLAVARSAVVGESPAAAVLGAARMLGARLGAVVSIALAFFVLELVVSAASSAIAGSISASAEFDPAAQMMALAPRAALYVAAGAVLAWLEVGRQGALAMLAANDAGLLEPPAPPKPVPPAPAVLQRPEEPIIEALPIAEPVIEALPAPEPGEEAPKGTSKPNGGE